MSQQAGTGIGIVANGGKSWSGGATRSDGAANRKRQINEKRPNVFFEIAIDGRVVGRLVMELFGDVVPLTTENFRCLATGERGISPINKKRMYFKGCPFHRIVPGVGCEGGDFERGDGKGGHSVYNMDGDGLFADESFRLKHDRPGILTMANRGPGTNGARFFITSKPAPNWDGKHVVFGTVIQGMDILRKMESAGTSTGRPQWSVTITDAGELDSEALKKRKLDDDKRQSSGKEASSSPRVVENDGQAPMPPGWEKKESRSTPGLFYYVHKESGQTQFERPKIEVNQALLDAYHEAKNATASGIGKGHKSEKKDMDSSTLDKDAHWNRACMVDEIRIVHILKKHKDFWGKPATSWRKKEVVIKKEQAKEELEKIKIKVHNQFVGGGLEQLRQKFGNIARIESDCDKTAKRGGDMGPVHKKSFKSHSFAKAAFSLAKPGDISDVVETVDGMHLIIRLE